MGCGFLPPVTAALPWDHPGREPAKDELDQSGRTLLPVCPGYACGLPEVIESSQAHLFLKNGGLSQFCDGDSPSPALRDAVTILECEYSRVMDWSSKQMQGGK